MLKEIMEKVNSNIKVGDEIEFELHESYWVGTILSWEGNDAVIVKLPPDLADDWKRTYKTDPANIKVMSYQIMKKL